MRKRRRIEKRITVYEIAMMAGYRDRKNISLAGMEISSRVNPEEKKRIEQREVWKEKEKIYSVTTYPLYYRAMIEEVLKKYCSTMKEEIHSTRGEFI